jgi:SAM-dependent methyltransferase
MVSAKNNDRRKQPRVRLQLPLELKIYNPGTAEPTVLRGHTLNISSHGVTFTLDSPVGELSVVELTFPSKVGPVSITGWMAWEDEAAGIYGVQFDRPDRNLTALIDAALEANNSGVAPVPDRRRGERRAESSSNVSNENRTRLERRKASFGRNTRTAEFSSFDRRTGLRVKVDISAKVKHSDGRWIPAKLETLSETGVSMRLPQALPEFGEVEVSFDCDDGGPLQLSIHLQWQFQERERFNYGGRLTSLDETANGRLLIFLIKALRQPTAVSDRRLQSTIVSELIAYKNRQGREVVAFHDHRAAATFERDPLIIIPSAYAETKKDALQTAYYLVSNGFQVIRFDNTNHTGESEGDILHITLNQFAQDLLATVDFAERQLGHHKVGVVATSLSCRTALKAASSDNRIAFLLGLVPAVDVRYTLRSVYCEDLVGTFKEGKLWGITNVLGCNTYLDGFLRDVIDNGFDELSDTKSDVQNIQCPMVFLAAERDPWVNFRDVKQVLQASASTEKEIHVIPAMHTLKENPKAARAAFRLIVSRALKYMVGRECSPSKVIEPSLRWLAIQNRIEKQRMRLLSIFEKQDSHQFWAKYLDQFHFINELPDYRHLLHTLYECLRGLHPGETIVDAGCGNGTFGLWLLTALALQAKNDRTTLNSTVQRPIKILCMDYVQDALDAAREHHETLLRQLFSDLPSAPVQFSYAICDLDGRIPVGDASVDKIVSNLVISYLQNPVNTMREFARILKPGGRCAVSTLKPYADTSEIYRNYVSSAPGETHVEKTRRLLNNAGDIKLKEAEGHFSFFGEDELLRFASAANAKAFEVFRSFADQANVLVADF